jgi:predicted TIM-barrel fold metal-dependent hydrolase
MKIDVHQHLWTEPLVQALASRRELPFVRPEHGLSVLFLAGERPYVIDLEAETPTRRAALVEQDGLDRALLCVSSPLGIESLPRAQALELIDAYYEGALALDDRFGLWGAIALDRPDPADVDHALSRGCVGISLPAGALADIESLARLCPVLRRLELHGAPLFVHPGPGPTPGRAVGKHRAVGETSLIDPLWWPALTRYVAEMQAAWLAFLTAGRATHPELRVVFSMLAGLAPLHAERLRSRGGPAPGEPDPLIFYDTSSYGSTAVGMLERIVGSGQLLYGSDRPVVEPREHGLQGHLDWDAIADATGRALGLVEAPPPVAAGMGRERARRGRHLAVAEAGP